MTPAEIIAGLESKNRALTAKNDEYPDLVEKRAQIERNYNMVELGPRGTGKSHLFQQISPYAHLISGGKATVAQMFVHMGTGQKGLVCMYDVVCFDETGSSVNKEKHWIHSAGTENFTYYAIHKNRGHQAMDDICILPQFKGTAIHDFWSSYLKYECSHGLCNAHHLRNLTK